MQPPGKGYIQSAPPIQQTSGSSPIGSALGNLANAGQNLTKLAIDLDPEKYRQILASSELDMSRASSAIQKDLIGNADPETHEGIARERYENVKSKILDNQKLSLKQRNELSQRIDLYSENQITKISTDAKIMQVENGKRLQMSRADLYREQGDYDGAASVYDEGAGTYWSKEEAEVAKNKMMSERSRSFHEQALAEDPQGYLDRLEGKIRDEDGNELYPELTPGAKARRIKEANSAVKDLRMNSYDDAEQGIYSGEIDDVKQIDEMGDKLTPKMKAILKNNIEKRNSDNAERAEKLPVFQQELSGRIDRMIGDYNPNGEARDDNYAMIKSEIMMMTNDQMKDERLKELDDIRNGREAEIKDIADWMKVQAKEDIKAGSFGRVPKVEKKKKTLRAYLEDGFYNDTAKLKELGFSDKAIKRIQNAEEEINEKDTKWDETASTNEIRTKIFQEEWLLKRGEVKADQAIIEFANALSVVKEGGLDAFYSEYEDEDSIKRANEAQKEIDLKAGKLLLEINKYIRSQKGNINMEDASEFLRSQSVNIESGDTDDTWEKLPERELPEREVTSGDLLQHLGSMKSTSSPDSLSFKTNFSSSSARASRAKSGGATVLLDSNWKGGDGITSPLVVIPDNATDQQRKAAQSYAEGMANIHNSRFGRKVKPRVVTRSENGRGRSNAFHTEGFAVTDTEMVSFLKTKEGREEYMNLLKSTLGTMSGVEFTLPHSSKDPGAVHNGVSEVALAKYLITGK